MRRIADLTFMNEDLEKQVEGQQKDLDAMASAIGNLQVEKERLE